MPDQSATAQAVVQRVRRGPVVVKAAQLSASQHASQTAALARRARPLHDDFDSLWGTFAPQTQETGRQRVRPFPHTDLRRLQLLGILDAMVNSVHPPPTYAVLEVLSTLERFHAGAASADVPENTATATAVPIIGTSHPEPKNSFYSQRRPQAPAATAGRLR